MLKTTAGDHENVEAIETEAKKNEERVMPITLQIFKKRRYLSSVVNHISGILRALNALPAPGPSIDLVLPSEEFIAANRSQHYNRGRNSQFNTNREGAHYSIHPAITIFFASETFFSL